MWLRSHGYRRSGAPGAATAMKSDDSDPHIVRITVVFGNPRRHRQAGQARRQLYFRSILRDGFAAVVSLRSSVTSAQPAAPQSFDLLGMGESVKKRFCRFQVDRVRPRYDDKIRRPASSSMSLTQAPCITSPCILRPACRMRFVISCIVLTTLGWLGWPG